MEVLYMKTTFTARHFDSSTELKNYSIESVQKLEQFFDRIFTTDIILEPSSDDDQPCKAELNVQVPKAVLNGSEYGETYDQAINKVVNNLSRQLKKHKAKRLNQHS